MEHVNWEKTQRQEEEEVQELNNIRARRQERQLLEALMRNAEWEKKNAKYLPKHKGKDNVL